MLVATNTSRFNANTNFMLRKQEFNSVLLCIVRQAQVFFHILARRKALCTMAANIRSRDTPFKVIQATLLTFSAVSAALATDYASSTFMSSPRDAQILGHPHCASVGLKGTSWATPLGQHFGFRCRHPLHDFCQQLVATNGAMHPVPGSDFQCGVCKDWTTIFVRRVPAPLDLELQLGIAANFCGGSWQPDKQVTACSKI